MYVGEVENSEFSCTSVSSAGVKPAFSGTFEERLVATLAVERQRHRWIIISCLQHHSQPREPRYDTADAEYNRGPETSAASLRPLRCSRDFNRLIQPYIASTRDVSLPALLTRHCIVLEGYSRWDSQALKARVSACLVVDLVAQPARTVPR